MISIALSLFARLETGTNRVRQLEIRESDSIEQGVLKRVETIRRFW